MNDERKTAAYMAQGRITVREPTTSFPKSFITASILFLAAVLRNSLISKMLAEATEGMIRKGIKMLEVEVTGLTKDSTAKASGTRT